MQQVEMTIEQLNLLRVPGLPQLSHSRHFLQQFLFLLYPDTAAKVAIILLNTLLLLFLILFAGFTTHGTAYSKCCGNWKQSLLSAMISCTHMSPPKPEWNLQALLTT